MPEVSGQHTAWRMESEARLRCESVMSALHAGSKAPAQLYVMYMANGARKQCKHLSRHMLIFM